MKITCYLSTGAIVHLMYKLVKFPGGELHPTIMGNIPDNTSVIIMEKLAKNSDDVMEILLVKDALDRIKNPTIPVTLRMPYAPYARQDRVDVYGTALSSKVFANLINAANFNKVEICDSHSPVMTALLNKVVDYSQYAGLCKVEGLYKFLDSLVKADKLLIVAPDSGAQKKTLETAKRLGCTNVAFCNKLRDPLTGKLSGFDVEDVLKQTASKDYEVVLLIDDICDGGGTFLGIADEIKKQHPKVNLHLHVTHGIFSNNAKERLGEMFSKVTSTFDWTE